MYNVRTFVSAWSVTRQFLKQDTSVVSTFMVNDGLMFLLLIDEIFPFVIYLLLHKLYTLL